jgi:hypothetical protein
MHPDPDALPFLDEHGVEVAAPPQGRQRRERDFQVIHV